MGIEEGCHSRTTPKSRMTHRHRFHGTATFNMTHTESTFKIRSTYTYTESTTHMHTHDLEVKSGSCWQSFSQQPTAMCRSAQICDNSQLHLAFASSFTGRGMA